LTLDDKYIEEPFIPEDIAANRRKHVVPYLMLTDENDTPNTLMKRVEIWAMYCDKIPAKEAMKAVGLKKSDYYMHLKACKEKYDTWVTEHGLGLHGDAANRLEDTIADIDLLIVEHQELMQECKEDGDVSGYTKLSKIVADLIDKRAKYMGCEPVKEVKIALTSAEETRRKMQELFPSDDGEDMGEGE
jgi:hypothetical protein